MATRFRKHRTRKMKQKKSLKTRRQRGGIFGFGSKKPPHNNNKPRKGLVIRIPTQTSVETQGWSPATYQEELENILRKFEYQDVPKNEGNVIKVEDKYRHTFIDHINELNTLGFKLANERNIDSRVLDSQSWIGKPLTEQEKQYFKVFVTIVFLSYMLREFFTSKTPEFSMVSQGDKRYAKELGEIANNIFEEGEDWFNNEVDALLDEKVLDRQLFNQIRGFDPRITTQNIKNLVEN